MRKLFLLFILYLFISCEKNDLNNCFESIYLNTEILLSNPEFINLETPTGWVYVNKGFRNIIIQNTGIGSTPYKAFDRECPNHDCTSPMTFDGSLKLICSCDKATYSILDGSPQNNELSCFAYEYKVIESGNTLIITNF